MKTELRTNGKRSLEIPRYDYGYQSIHFNLKQQREPMKLTQIMLVITIEGRRYRVYTKHKVEPAFWDRENGCCKCSELLSKRVKTRMANLNLVMSKIKTGINLADMKAAEKGQFLSIDSLRSIIQSTAPHKGRGVQSSSHTQGSRTSPLSIMRSIADSFESQISSKGKKGTASSRKTYLYCCRRLEDFLRDIHMELDDFSQLDRSFYNEFTQWLNTRRFYRSGSWKQYTAATVQNTLSGIHNLHNKAYEAGYCEAPANFRHGFQHTSDSDQGKIYLAETELERIMNVSPLSQKDVQIRDMFVLSAYTGLRISDINRLNSAVITNDTIRLFQKKTHGYVAIPILREVSGIIEKYSRAPGGFPSINPALANKSIKNICKKAGIDALTPVNEYRGGEMLTRNSPKYDLVSFHTARRSCISNLFRRGYSANYLMIMSGHKSLSSFQRYIRTSREELASDFIKELKKKKAL